MMYKHTLYKHTMYKHTMYKHTMYKHTMYKHIYIEKHTLYKHTLYKHTLYKHTLYKHTLYKHFLLYVSNQSLKNYKEIISKIAKFSFLKRLHPLRSLACSNENNAVQHIVTSYNVV